MAETNLITPEEIAREAADGAVAVSKDEASGFWDVTVGGKLVPQYHNAPEIAENRAREMRNLLDRLILAAIERFAREVPVPGGLSAERVVEIQERETNGMPAGVSIETRFVNCSRDRGELLADNAHLRRALHDCGQDGTALVWAAGWKAGRQAMAEEMLAASREAFSADDFAARFDEIRDRIRRGARQTDGSIT